MGETGSVAEPDRIALEAAYESINRALATGQYRALLERHLDAGFEYLGPAEVPEPGPYRGYEEFERFLRFFSEPFDEVKLEIEIVEAVEGGILYRQATAVTGGGSGVTVGDRSWAVAILRDGRLLKVTEAYEREEALQRAGVWSPS